MQAELSPAPFAMQAGLMIHSQPRQSACAAVALPSALSASTPGNCTPDVTTDPVDWSPSVVGESGGHTIWFGPQSLESSRASAGDADQAKARQASTAAQMLPRIRHPRG